MINFIALGIYAAYLALNKDNKPNGYDILDDDYINFNYDFLSDNNNDRDVNGVIIQLSGIQIGTVDSNGNQSIGNGSDSTKNLIEYHFELMS
jgi:hypothetical protein